jgi:hypothetical protein
MRRVLAVVLAVAALASAGTGPAQAAQDRASIERAVGKLERQADALRSVHDALLAAKQDYQDIHETAATTLRNNTMKVFLKGALEVADKAQAGASVFNAALDTAIAVYTSTYWEPALTQTVERRISPVQLQERAMLRNAKIRRMTDDLATLLRAPLASFDDDVPPLRSAKPWWRRPDGTPDAELERIIRKTNVIKQLSRRVVRQFGYEAKRVRREVRAIKADIQALKAALPKPGADGAIPRASAYLPRVAEMPQHRGYQPWTKHCQPNNDKLVEGPRIAYRAATCDYRRQHSELNQINNMTVQVVAVRDPDAYIAWMKDRKFYETFRRAQGRLVRSGERWYRRGATGRFFITVSGAVSGNVTTVFTTVWRKASR